jgi:hypothetical protein
MTFREALDILGISEFHDRIINSNSHGELFHLGQYFDFVRVFEQASDGDKQWFVGFFKGCVEHAEKTWKRPESVFQHIGKILLAQAK